MRTEVTYKVRVQGFEDVQIISKETFEKVKKHIEENPEKHFIFIGEAYINTGFIQGFEPIFTNYLN